VRLVTALAALLACAALARGDDEPLTLRVRPTDEPVTLEVAVLEETFLDGRELTTRRDTELFALDLTATEVADELLATLTLVRAVGQLQIADREPTFYDSDETDAGPIPTGAGRPGRPLVLRVSSRGEALEVVSYGGVPAEQARGAMTGELFARIKLDGMARPLILGLHTPYPTAPCVIAESWRTPWRTGLPRVNGIELTLTHFVLDHDGDRVTIITEGRFDGETDEGDPARASINGRLVVSRADGLPLEGRLTTGVAIDMGAGVARSHVERTVRRRAAMATRSPAPEGRVQPAPDGY
jgi:hypothetical protein